MTTYLDFGSAFVRWMRNGTVFQEPAQIACTPDGCRVPAYGVDAARLRLRAAASVDIVYPFKDQDYPDETTVPFLRYFQAKMQADSYCLAIADDISAEERERIRESCAEAGFAPLDFADILAGLHRGASPNTLIVHSGARRTYLAFYEDGVLKRGRALLWGGRTLDGSIREHIGRETGLEIAPQTAEGLKFLCGCERLVQGLDTESGMPRNERIPLTLCEEAIGDDLLFLAEAVNAMLKTECKVQHLKLSGGMANCVMLMKYLRQKIDLPIIRDACPELAVLYAMNPRKACR